MTTIKKLHAREILDSRGNPTLEVEVHTSKGVSRAAVPSGASTGIHEAVEKRDQQERYFGLGVKTAVKFVEKKIFPQIKTIPITDQYALDQKLITLDGTENKQRLGANTLLAVSLAVARAAAKEKDQPLFAYLTHLIGTKKCQVPQPYFNVINGGRHSDSRLQIQEFMLVPQLSSFKENLRAGSEVYHQLKKELHKKYGKATTNVGDEGGFVPIKMHKTIEVLQLLNKAIKDAGYKNKMTVALDCAASEFFKKGKYHLDGKKLTKEQLLSYYLDLLRRYPVIFSLEDPFEQDDFASFAELQKRSSVQIVGDDLTVTTTERVEEALREHSGNCLLVKLNQVGTLTETIEAVKIAREKKWKIIVSHRSGETEDSFIADFAVALAAEGIKSGAPCRGERTAKYNQLLRIEEQLRTKSF